MRQASRGFRKWMVVGLCAAGAMTWLLATTFAGSATGAQSQAATTWITVSGSAFTPEDSDCFDYNHEGYSGVIEDDDECEYVADVTLPHGSTVLGVWAFFDSDGEDADLHLEENDSQDNHTDIADINMPDDCDNDGQDCVAADFHLNSPGVNNAHYSYGLWLDVNSCCGFDLYRVAIKVGLPAGGAAGPATPLGPAIKSPSSHGGADDDL